MTPPLILTEGDAAQAVELSAGEANALNALGIAVVTPRLGDGLFDAAAGTKIGAVTVGARQVVVRPKITDINRLIFMLGYARNPHIWRDDPIGVESNADLLPAIAEAFVRIASRAVERGLLPGYRTVSEALPVLRGPPDHEAARHRPAVGDPAGVGGYHRALGGYHRGCRPDAAL